MSGSTGIEVRSYRDVFSLERRIYRIDRIRLNPGGVPIRGVLYGVAIAVLMLALSALPVTGWLLALLPWLIRDVALPVGAAALLTVIRLEGRPFHVAAHALVRHAICARRLCALHAAPSPQPGHRWRPPELLSLADGSDPHLRRVRFSGRGVALVAIPHQCTAQRGRAARLAIRELPSRRPLARGRALALAHKTRVDVYPR